MLEPLHAQPHEQPGERQDPGRQANPADEPGKPRAIPAGELHHLGWRGGAGLGPVLDEHLQVGHAAGGDEGTFVDACAERVLERYHQLDPFQRTEPQFFERRSRRDLVAPGILRDECADGVGAGGHEPRCAPRVRPVTNGGTFQLPSAVGARQFRLGPDQRAPDPLVVVELGIRRANHRIDVGAGIDDQHRVHPFVAAAACPQADDRRLAHARQLVQHLLHILGEDVQPLGRDDHFFLAAADEQLAVGADLADVAGVEPAVLERLRGFGGGVEVALRDVLSPHQDLAIVGHLHLDAGDRLANRAALRAERMVERHDRCGLGQPVALDDREPEVAPPLLEVAIERGGPDHERPELRAEQAMCITVMPPAASDARHGTGRAAALQPRRLHLAGLFRRRRASHYMFAEHIEDLGDGDEHRNPAALHLVGDVAGVVAAHEDHRA